MREHIEHLKPKTVLQALFTSAICLFMSDLMKAVISVPTPSITNMAELAQTSLYSWKITRYKLVKMMPNTCEAAFSSPVEVPSGSG